MQRQLLRKYDIIQTLLYICSEKASNRCAGHQANRVQQDEAGSTLLTKGGENLTTQCRRAGKIRNRDENKTTARGKETGQS